MMYPSKTTFMRRHGEQIFMPHDPVEQVFPSWDVAGFGDCVIATLL
jgi:hypothetical protein